MSNWLDSWAETSQYGRAYYSHQRIAAPITKGNPEANNANPNRYERTERDVPLCAATIIHNSAPHPPLVPVHTVQTTSLGCTTQRRGLFFPLRIPPVSHQRDWKISKRAWFSWNWWPRAFHLSVSGVVRMGLYLEMTGGAGAAELITEMTSANLFVWRLWYDAPSPGNVFAADQSRRDEQGERVHRSVAAGIGP